MRLRLGHPDGLKSSGTKGRKTSEKKKSCRKPSATEDQSGVPGYRRRTEISHTYLSVYSNPQMLWEDASG